MKIYKISQNKNDEYDTYISAVVVAKNEDEATRIHPDGSTKWKDSIGWGLESETWVSSPDDVIVEFIGNAPKGIKEMGVIVASFKQG